MDETIENDEGAELAVDVAVLELLADGPGGLARARGLELDDLDKVGNAAEIVDIVALGGEVLNVDGHRRVWLLLKTEDMLVKLPMMAWGKERRLWGEREDGPVNDAQVAPSFGLDDAAEKGALQQHRGRAYL